MSLVRVLVVPVILGLLALAAGCGGNGRPSSPGDALTIVYEEDASAGGGAVTWTLACDPAGGSHPDPAAACAALDSVELSAFDPVPGGTACAEVFGGPQRAEVSGTVRGEPVTAVFDRRNGCEIDRWDALSGLLPSLP